MTGLEDLPFLGETGHVISLVGGGGKTTLLYALARWYSAQGQWVLVSTTTHIRRPDANYAPDEAARDALWQAGTYAVAGVPAEGGKLTMPSHLADWMAEADTVLLEADGAKRHPCKAPAAHEPVLLRSSDIVLAAAGLSAQGIARAEAMKNSIEVLEPLLQTGGTGEEMPVVVIATVEGDIHDIGKNLVALMLKNHGFHVIDLGKDVPQAKILESAKEHHAEFIALSALMTTTMQRMREIVAAAKEEGITAKIIIGGAVITQEYADEIGADGYSKDAADAVKLAKSLM